MNKEFLNKKNIVLYGADKKGKDMSFLLEEMGYSIHSITDGNPAKWQTEYELNGIKHLVVQPENIINSIIKCPEQFVIIVTISNPLIILQHLQMIENICPVYSYQIIEELFADYQANKLHHNYKVDFEKPFITWFEGLPSELEWWCRDVVVESGPSHSRYIQACKSNKFNRDSFIKELQNGDTVLDIGSGIVSSLGYHLDSSENKINLIPVDSLAYFYNSINNMMLKKETQSSKSNITFALGEYLSYFFNRNSVEAIWMSNALDHCINPVKVIIECLNVLKIDGELKIFSFLREAMNENYAGLHQWNIDFNTKNEFIIWNKTSSVNITELFSDYADIHVKANSNYFCRKSGSSYGEINISLIKKRNIDTIIAGNPIDEKEIGKILSCIFRSFTNEANALNNCYLKWIDYFKNIKQEKL